VVFSLGLGGGELFRIELSRYAFALGLALFATIFAIRMWARGLLRPIRTTGRSIAAPRSRV
jgi:hypothetical protein